MNDNNTNVQIIIYLKSKPGLAADGKKNITSSK